MGGDGERLWFNLVPLAVLPCPKSFCSSQAGGSLPEQREGKRGIVLEPPHEPSSFPTAQSQSSARAESSCCHAGGMVIFHQKKPENCRGTRRAPPPSAGFNVLVFSLFPDLVASVSAVVRARGWEQEGIGGSTAPWGMGNRIPIPSVAVPTPPAAVPICFQLGCLFGTSSKY